MGVIAMALLIHGKNYFDAYTFLAVIMVIAILLQVPALSASLYFQMET